jgi:peptide/nickel transport system permease protein
MSDQIPPIDLPGATELPVPATEMRGDGAETPTRRLFRRFRHDKAAMVGFTIVVILVFIALFAPYLTRYSYTSTSLPGATSYTGPSGRFWLGTDSAGRDIFSRLLVGTRASLFVSALVVLFATIAALPLGMIAGFFGGWVDAIIMRFMDALFTFPTLTLTLAVAALLGNSLTNAALAIAVSFIPGFVRLIRAQVLAIREETYIEASRSIGATDSRLLRRHIFPNVISPIIVQMALAVGYAILAEAGLGFLGFGVQIPQPSWGNMLQDGYGNIVTSAWQMIPPGVAIVIAVLGFNLTGDGLRDALGRETHSGKG